MSTLPLWSLFTYACLITVSVTPLSATLVHVKTDKLNYPRNLDSKIHSIVLKRVYSCCLDVMTDMTASADLYLPIYLAPFISSNETILNMNCPVFSHVFSCSSPDCIEDVSATYSLSYPRFSSNNLTRIDLTRQGLSIADGAWKINSSLLYIHDCDLPFLSQDVGIGQIGLGLNGKAYQNFKTPNPIFSIFVTSEDLAELIFGFNSTYVQDSKTEISLPCDLDWKVSITSFSIGNSTISSADPMFLIFDLRTPALSLPSAYYEKLRNYFFQKLTEIPCRDQEMGFICFDSSSNDFPLVFTLRNGTQVILPQSTYWYDHYHFQGIDVRAHNSTFSGVEYIVLGLQTLSQFYTVFQQHEDKSTTITLYPHSSSAISIQSNSEYTSSPEQPEASQTSGSSISKTSNTSKEPQSQPESSNVETHKNDKPDQNILSLVLVGLVVVIICAFIVFIFARARGWFGKEEIAVRPKSTVELNESSYFVPTNNTMNNGNIGEDIDLSE